MPSTSINRTLGAGVSSFSLSLPLDRGRLKAVSVHQYAAASIPGALSVSCSLASPKASLEHSMVFLFAGSFTSNNPIGWTGDLPLAQTDALHARFNTTAAAEIRLSVTTEVP